MLARKLALIFGEKKQEIEKKQKTMLTAEL